MSDSKPTAIAVNTFVAAYVETHKAGGTIQDVAKALGRDVEYTRAKKNSVATQLKAQGMSLPKLAKVERQKSANMSEAISMLSAYNAEFSGSDESENS